MKCTRLLRHFIQQYNRRKRDPRNGKNRRNHNEAYCPQKSAHRNVVPTQTQRATPFQNLNNTGVHDTPGSENARDNDTENKTRGVVTTHRAEADDGVLSTAGEQPPGSGCTATSRKVDFRSTGERMPIHDLPFHSGEKGITHGKSTYVGHGQEHRELQMAEKTWNYLLYKQSGRPKVKLGIFLKTFFFSQLTQRDKWCNPQTWGNQELLRGFPHGWQGPGRLSHHHCLPAYVSKKLG